MSTPSWGQPDQPQPGQQWAQPGWGQQPPPAAPGAPKRSGKAKAGCFGCLGVLGLIVVVGIVGAIASGGKKSTSTSQSAAPAKAAGAPAGKQAAPSSAPKPKVVLTASGSGIKNTAQFTVGDTWTLKWSFNCASYGYKGNFIVSDDDGMPLVNELKMKGSGSSPQYSGGTHHLEVNSECSWTLKAINGG